MRFYDLQADTSTVAMLKIAPKATVLYCRVLAGYHLRASVLALWEFALLLSTGPSTRTVEHCATRSCIVLTDSVCVHE